MKVLVVDDDADFAEGIAINLELGGHEVSFAYSGEEAVHVLQNEDFHLILMDFRMGEMNGLETYLKIREMKPGTKTIIMTAYEQEGLKQRAVAAGALDVLHKPVSSEKLLEAVFVARRSRTILLADDDPEFSEGLQITLNEAGYSVEVARTGEEALDKVVAGNVDALLLDVRMPRLNGLEVCEALIKSGNTLPTIIVTGYLEGVSDDIGRLTKASIRKVLAKPIDTSELLRAVDDAI